MILRDDYDGDYELINGGLYELDYGTEPSVLRLKNIDMENLKIKSLYDKESNSYSYLNINGVYASIHCNQFECEYDYIPKNNYSQLNNFYIGEMERKEDKDFFAIEKNGKTFYILSYKRNDFYLCLNEKPKNVIFNTLAEEILIETNNDKYYKFNTGWGTLKEVKLVDTPILKNYRE